MGLRLREGEQVVPQMQVTKRHIRYFDSKTCEYLGQFPLSTVSEGYLRQIFGLEPDNPMLFSYRVTSKQQAFIERVCARKLKLDKYQYFIECDFIHMANHKTANH
ncbi:DUF7683 domain-containing protein [Aliikangiella sp. IMCC44653]